MFQHFVAVDWAMSNMAIARLTPMGKAPKVIEARSDIKELKAYLQNLQGSVCLALEESTSSQWLYVELKDLVDKIIVCDPYRNKLLNEGSKTDKVDALKLVKLLKADLLKEVFHTTDELVELRKIVSGYEDLIRSGVRLKCQRAALFRSVNKSHKKEKELSSSADQFVLHGLDLQIKKVEEERKRYLEEFKRLKKKHKEIKLIAEIPGMGDILAVKVVARVIDARRFTCRNHFFSYCGLVKIDKISGGRVYGKRTPRYCRTLKGAFKIAATVVWDNDNPFKNYYNILLERGVAPHNARNAVARKIASTVYGVLKSGERFNPEITRSLCKIVDL